MKRLNTIFLSIFSFLFVILTYTSIYGDSKINIFFVLIFISLLLFVFPMIKYLLFKNNPRAFGIVTNISDGKIKGRNIMTIDFEFANNHYQIYESRNVEDIYPIGMRVKIIVDVKCIDKSTIDNM